MQEHMQYPKGHWMGIGIGIGMAIGIPLALVMGAVIGKTHLGIALGPAIGLGLGTALGALLENRHRDQIRPPTDSEQRNRKFAVILALGLFLLGLLAFITVYAAR